MRRSTAFVMSLVLGVALFAGWPATTAAAVTPRLPDLGMAQLRDFDVYRPGPRLLRFTTEIVNVGTGPFEITGRRASTLNRSMTVWQRVYNDDGSSTSGRTSAIMNYTGLDHAHWHVINLERYTIRPVDSRTVARGAKVGFCFYDSSRYRLSLPGAPQDRVYGYTACGAPESIELTMGLSVGWSDVYPAGLTSQWIDITGLPNGDYIVSADADPYLQFTETTRSNNRTWTRIRIAADDQVTVLEQGPAA